MKETLINSAGNYMFKFNNKNTRTRYEIYMFKSNNKVVRVSVLLTFENIV